MVDTAVSSHPAKLGNLRYAMLWRWHMYAGLFVAPFLLVLAITGALYVFKPQIENRLYGAMLYVEPKGAALPLSTQLSAARNAVPARASLRSVTVDHNPDRSTEFVFTLSAGEHRSVYVDPYRARVLGALSVEHRIMQVIRTVHRSLLLGTAGRWLMELAACWTLVMLITGVALWWPASLSSMMHYGFRPRMTLRGRALWREWHRVGGIVLAMGGLFFVLSGLPWSGVWGVGLQKLVEAVSPAVASTVSKASHHVTPSSTAHEEDEHAEHNMRNISYSATPAPPAMASGKHMSDLALVDTPWALGRAALPLGGDAASLALDGVADIVRQHGMVDFQLSMPEAGKGVFMASYAPGVSNFLRNNLDRQRMLSIDPASGDILQDRGFAQFSPVAKLISFGVALHTGEFFGLLNQCICAAISLGLAALAASGCWMWWLRRPAGRLAGAPRAVSSGRFYGWKISLGILGILFPLMGVSMLGVVCVEYGARRINRSSPVSCH